MKDREARSGGESRSFFGELRRRHVFRVLAVYVAVALGILQVASLTFGPLHLPSWALTLVVVLALLGLPVAAVLAWAFESTPEGVRPTAGGAGGSWTHAAGLLVGAVGLTVAAGFGARAWLGAPALPSLGGSAPAAQANGTAAAGADLASATAPEPGTSSEIRLAVLPLDDRSPDPHAGYFAGGMTDELTSALATMPGLQVVGERSAARFASSTTTIPQIADSLDVRYVSDTAFQSALAEAKARLESQRRQVRRMLAEEGR